MSWQKYLLCVIYVVSLIAYVAQTGKPRRPTSVADAASAVGLTAVMVWLVVTS